MQLRTRFGILSLLFLTLLTYMFFPFKTIDPELQPYYDEYINIAKQYCSEDQLFLPGRIDIEFSDYMPKEEAVAYCLPYPFFSFFVKVRKKYWNLFTEDEKYQILMHEFSHCVLKEDHSDDPWHFMYYQLNDLSKPIVKYQLSELLINKCRNKKYESRNNFNHDLYNGKSSRVH